MIIRRLLLLFLLACTCFAQVAEVMAAAAAKETVKKVAKKVVEKIVEKGGDKIMDSAIGALILASGLHDGIGDLDDLWKKIEQVNLGMVQKFIKIEYVIEKQNYKSDVVHVVKGLYDLVIEILKGNGTSYDSEHAFPIEYEKHLPITILNNILNYLKSDGSSMLQAQINLEHTYGGSKEYVGAIKQDLHVLLNQLKIVRAFRFGWQGEEGLNDWIDSNFVGAYEDDDYISNITIKYLEQFEPIFENGDFMRRYRAVAQWMDDYIDAFSNSNPYWDHGIVEGLVHSVLNRLKEQPPVFNTTDHVADAIYEHLKKITTTDNFDIIITAAFDKLEVERNNSNSVKLFVGKKPIRIFDEHRFNVVIFKSKLNFVISEEQKADMKAYESDEHEYTDVMKVIRTREDSVHSIALLCYFPGNPYKRTYAQLYRRNTTSPIRYIRNYSNSGCAKHARESYLFVSVA